MKVPFRMRVLPAVMAAVLGGSLVWADEVVTDTDVEVAESVSDVPSGKIAGFFSDFLGGEMESQATVEGLRSGAIAYQPPQPAEGEGTGEVADGDATETPETEGAEGEDAVVGMGYGNVFITLALAEQLAMSANAELLEGELGMTAEESVNEVLYMRQVEGMGWGQIAKELGVNLGEVISGIRSNRPDKVEQLKGERLAKADKAAGSERVQKVEKVAKVERPEKLERPAKPERMDRPERPVKPERPERPSR